MAIHMDERALVLLRRRLEALSYTEHLDAASAPLVARLVDDLIRTTDSYRSVKSQASKYAQEVASFNTKVSTLTRRCRGWLFLVCV
jgi:centrosomal protein CEP135